MYSHVMSQLILGSVPVAGLVAEANGGPSHPEDAVGDHVLLVVARVECVGGDLRRNKQGNTVGPCLGGVQSQKPAMSSAELQ